MTFRLQALCALSLFTLSALAPTGAAAASGIVSCSTFAAALRDTTQTSPFRTVMKNYSSTYTNPGTGQTFRFLAVRPANPNAPAYETLVFFNGTSQITPDWPVGMIVNSSSSLCDNNALIFSDYPGIGDTTQPADADFTFDNTQTLFAANRLEPPYFNNISYAQFAGQRRLNFMFGYGSCPEASTASWSSANCAFNPNQVTNSLYNSALVVNGSPCATIETTSDVSSPIVLDCPQFATRLGGVYIFNGAEDMFIRHDYANALCNWFNSSGRAPCTVNTYNDAGHGVQYIYASAIYSVINGALPRPR